jgi:hypothetical protein
MPNGEVLTAIRVRRNMQSFTDAQISTEQLDVPLDAANWRRAAATDRVGCSDVLLSAASNKQIGVA